MIRGTVITRIQFVTPFILAAAKAGFDYIDDNHRYTKSGK